MGNDLQAGLTSEMANDSVQIIQIRTVLFVIAGHVIPINVRAQTEAGYGKFDPVVEFGARVVVINKTGARTAALEIEKVDSMGR